jgi:hypothetical protein
MSDLDDDISAILREQGLNLDNVFELQEDIRKENEENKKKEIVMQSSKDEALKKPRKHALVRKQEAAERKRAREATDKATATPKIVKADENTYRVAGSASTLSARSSEGRVLVDDDDDDDEVLDFSHMSMSIGNDVLNDAPSRNEDRSHSAPMRSVRQPSALTRESRVPKKDAGSAEGFSVDDLLSNDEEYESAPKRSASAARGSERTKRSDMAVKERRSSSDANARGATAANDRETQRDRVQGWERFSVERVDPEQLRNEDFDLGRLQAKSSQRKTISLEGVTLQSMVEYLTEALGFDEVYRQTGIKFFLDKPKINSSLKALRKKDMDWARRRVEYVYVATRMRES